MKYWKLALTSTLLTFSTYTNAALVERLGGLAYYDTEADLTWLADANYAQTSGYDADGRMNWTGANAWAAGLDINGITGWRLADTPQVDTSCTYQQSGRSFGDNCSGSEMGNMFYDVLGGIDSHNITVTHNSNYDLFSNIQAFRYWSSTEYGTGINSMAWGFEFGDGSQDVFSKTNSLFAWAVHDGDVSAVPIPASVFLFSSGLIGLIGFAKRKAS